VTLTSSSASGNQWRLNGNPIGGATNSSYIATVAGNYTVTVTASGCNSAPSSSTTVTINPNPDATISAPASAVSGSTGNAASVPSAGAGATYAWGIVNGTNTAGTGTNAITFTAGAVGAVTLSVTVTTSAGCPASDTETVTVTAAPPAVTVTSVTPNNGSSLGGTTVTIGGSGFLAGASVTFNATAATTVTVVNATTITAKTPAHAAGAVNVTVTNTNTTTGTLSNGYTYNQQNFDPNGDSMIDPSDIFYLVAYLFTGGPAPAGVAGMVSGDSNGDSVVDPSDIFYAVNYLFSGGPAPYVRGPGGVTTTSDVGAFSGRVTLGDAVRRGERWFVPVIVASDNGSIDPNALSLRVRFTGEVGEVRVHRSTDLTPVFETSRRDGQTISYLVAAGQNASLATEQPRVVAEIEIESAGAVRMEIDPSLTMLVDGSGTQKATVTARTLRVRGVTIGAVPAERERTPGRRN
jgi:hypothetical protein